MFVWVLNTSLWNMENSTEFTHRFPESSNMQKQPSLGVLRKRFSENMQQIHKRTPMLKCDFEFAEYFQSTFSEENLWMADSERV